MSSHSSVRCSAGPLRTRARGVFPRSPSCRRNPRASRVSENPVPPHGRAVRRRLVRRSRRRLRVLPMRCPLRVLPVRCRLPVLPPRFRHVPRARHAHRRLFRCRRRRILCPSLRRTRLNAKSSPGLRARSVRTRLARPRRSAPSSARSAGRSTFRPNGIASAAEGNWRRSSGPHSSGGQPAGVIRLFLPCHARLVARGGVAVDEPLARGAIEQARRGLLVGGRRTTGLRSLQRRSKRGTLCTVAHGGGAGLSHVLFR